MNEPNKGFITIATGDKHYYQLAANLLYSYRYTTKEPYPFAIIAEEENEYTELFDDVIIVENPKRSFMDKFLLLKHCPYNETIFLDADILAYNDLNAFWEIFEGATDFSAIGANFALDQDGAWYDLDGLWKYADKLSYKVKVHMGICFIRQSVKLEKLYNDCMDIVRNYDKLTIKVAPKSVDEATMGIAMPINNMKATEEKEWYLAALPCMTKMKASILKNRLEYTTNWGKTVKEGGMLIHFGTSQTREPFYKFESECFKNLYFKKDKTLQFMIKYKLGTRRISLWVAYIYNRIVKKLENK